MKNNQLRELSWLIANQLFPRRLKDFSIDKQRFDEYFATAEKPNDMGTTHVYIAAPFLTDSVTLAKAILSKYSIKKRKEIVND